MKTKKIEERAKKIKPGRKDEKTLSKKKRPSTALGAAAEKDSDITERKRVEEVLRYQAVLLANTYDAIIASDEHYRLTAWNAAAESLYGWKEEEVLGRLGLDVIQTEFPGVEKSEMLRTIAEIGLWRGEVTQARKDGTRILVEVASIVLHDESGRITGYLSVNRDITERKTAEENLIKSKALLSETEKMGKIGGWVFDVEKLTQTWTEETFHILEIDLTESEPQVPEVLDFIAPAFRPMAEQAIRRAIEFGEPYDQEWEIITAKGNRRWVHAVAKADQEQGKTRRVSGSFQDITERMLVELQKKTVLEALRRSEENFRRSLDDSPLGVRVVTAKGETIYANKVLLDIYGYANIEELNKIPLKERYTPQSYAEFHIRKKTREEGDSDPSEYEIAIIRKNGEIRHLQVLRKEVLWNGAKQFQVIYQDISERKRAEEALKQANERLLLAIVAGGVGIWDLDVVNNKLTWDDQMFRLYGIAPDNFGGAYETWKARVHSEDVERGDAEVQMALRGEKEFDTEFRVVWPSGTIHHIRARARVHRDAAGQPTKLIGTNYDITERKQAEEALRISEEKYRLLVENAAEAILIAQDGILKFVNHMASEMTGYSMQELLSSPFLEFIHPDDRNMVGERYLRRLTGDVSQPRYAFRLVARDGSIKWVEIDAVLVDWEDRPATLNFLSDITERKQAESQREAALEALKESEVKYRTLIDMTGTGYLILDSQSRALDANQEYVRLSGHTKLHDILGKSVIAWTAEGAKQRNAEAIAQCAKNGFIRDFVTEYVDGGGKITPIEINASVDGEGESLRIVSLCRDITERKRAEEKIRNSLVEKEILLKEVHHRVKNNLMTIIGLIKMQEAKADNEMFDPLLQELEGRIRSMALVHESLHKSADLAHVNLQNYIETMSAQIYAQFGADRDIRFSVQAAGVDVNLDSAIPCGLILNELLTNAFKHAFPDGRPGSGAGNCEINVIVNQEGGMNALTVADNGVGLPADLDWEKSEALGLRLIKMLSQQIKGSIELDRSAGTVFRLKFPVAVP